ncbi:MAG: acyl carrier protein phosphodiesterase [Flavobacteriaceae bacterium]|nr:acyl carrier protein phosphodiesterase [Flavobacteriaceae bacterium]MDG1091598.1 acyl carrier protein phosphodiesterase [Flavobacteriaceae bacterium]
MNYLAHIYLSGTHTELRFGNFIADAVPGKQYAVYAKGIQEGILLHRAIDTFTDQHPLFRKHCKLLFPDFGHYSRVIVDMFYDHFLASLWHNYHPQTLEKFSEDFYNEIDQQKALLPHKMKRAFPYMKEQNWLIQYKSIVGLETILSQMERRTQFESNLSASVKNLETHYSIFKNDFEVFFEHIQIFVSSRISSSNNSII